MVARSKAWFPFDRSRSQTIAEDRWSFAAIVNDQMETACQICSDPQRSSTIRSSRIAEIEMSSIPAILSDPERLQAILKPKWKHTSDPKRSTAIQLSHNAHQFSSTKWRRGRATKCLTKLSSWKSCKSMTACTINLVGILKISIKR